MDISYRELLTPDRNIIVAFIILSLLSFFDMYAFGGRFVPCLIKPMTAPDLDVFWSEAMCSIAPFMVGVTIQFTWFSYFVIGIFVLALPYFLACLLTKIVFRKRGPGAALMRFLRLKR